MSKMSKMSKLISILVSLMLLLSACGSGTSDQEEASATTAIQTETSQQTEETEKANKAFEKYDQPITLEIARSLPDFIKFPEGDDIDHNIWVDFYEKELGIKLVTKWSGTWSEAADKKKLAMASGDIPDVLEVSISELQTLAKEGIIQDFGTLFNEYASPILKQLADADPELTKLSYIDGKQMAIPMYLRAEADNAPSLFIRKDWLENVNLSAPKTMDDVLKIADAFVNKDPDGNGKKDTQGLAMNKYLDDIGTYLGFVNGYGAYSKMWLDDGTGKLIYSSIQPEMRNALSKLREMYKSGLIDRDFYNKEVWPNIVPEIQSSKIGIWYGPAWTVGFIGDIKKQNPNADLIAVPAPYDPATKGYVQSPYKGSDRPFFVIKKGYKNPEAVIKLLNFNLEKDYGSYKLPEEMDDQLNKEGGKYFGLPWYLYQYAGSCELPNKNMLVQQLATKAFDNGEDWKTLPGYYQGVVKAFGDYKNEGKLDQIGTYYSFYGPNSSFGALGQLVEQKRLIFNKYDYSPTPTMLERNETLNKLELDTFIAIINGTKPIEAFDDFVQEWKKTGGDSITTEVNTWYSSNK